MGTEQEGWNAGQSKGQRGSNSLVFIRLGERAGREGSVTESSEAGLFVPGSGKIRVPKSNALATGLERGNFLVLHNKVFHTMA